MYHYVQQNLGHSLDICVLGTKSGWGHDVVHGYLSVSENGASSTTQFDTVEHSFFLTLWLICG